MKKLLLILSMTIFGLSYVNAQEKGAIEVGLGGGLSSANIFSSDSRVTPNILARLTYNVGISGEYYFSDTWGIKMNVIYDNKGWEQGTQDNPIGEIELNYITIPLKANWHLGASKNLYLSLGPYIGFLISSKVPSAASLFPNGEFESVDLGVNFAVGHKLRITEKLTLYAEIDLQSSFTNIFKTTSTNANTPAYRNGRFGLNIGAFFKL